MTSGQEKDDSDSDNENEPDVEDAIIHGGKIVKGTDYINTCT